MLSVASRSFDWIGPGLLRLFTGVNRVWRTVNSRVICLGFWMYETPNPPTVGGS